MSVLSGVSNKNIYGMKRIINLLLFLTAHQCLLAQNVGIGTNTPAYKLDVNGRMRVRTGTLGNNSTSSGIWMEDFRDGSNQAFVGMRDSIRVGFYGVGTIGWGFHFNTMSGDVAIESGQLGIGTLSPAFDIDINRPDPTIVFYDAGTDDHFSGLIRGDAENLEINAYRRPNVFPTTEVPGHLILQVNSVGPFVSSTAGNVGIGTATPDIKLHVTNGTDINAATGGYLQLGLSNNVNLAFDNNEIQARDNGSVTKLTLQNDGGGLQIGSGNGMINITAAGEVNRNNITGTANLLPLAFGRISSGGSIINSTGNFTVQKGVEGLYKITLSDETNVYANRNNYVILVTPYNTLSLGTGPIFIDAGINSDNTIEVRVAKPKVSYLNDSCSETCGPFSYITNIKFYDEIDNEFSILIYKY